jgi:hypothetical protein
MLNCIPPLSHERDRMTPRSLCLSVLIVASGVSAAAADDSKLKFERDIQPIVKAKCVECHRGADAKGGLELASPQGLLRGGDSGVVVAAGDLDKSLLWERIATDEMPPPDAPQLTAAERESIEKWIAGGAQFANPKFVRRVTQHDIIPILLLRCTVCHGARRREADLDLRTGESIRRGGKSGPAVIPGDPSKSLLIKRIVSEEMPPRRELVKVSVKPMPDNELRLLRQWIASGLPAEEAEPERPVEISDELRNHWAFVAPRRPLPPGSAARHPIDAFASAQLADRGMRMADAADRRVLIRRVHLDLLGLLPTPAEIQSFVEDEHPTAYEQMVERALASPRYGERWGRIWLDVAGYADSEGSQNEDRVRPNMYRYRDYAIRSFNMDKPYDRFLHEQIAGDELANYEKAPVIDEQLYDNLVATGFLRTAPDRTFAGITNFVPDRLEVIADEIQILGSGVMGLTLQCSRCHEHKFDPLPQRDYYRLAAALKGALDEHDWLKPEERRLPFVSEFERSRWKQNEDRIDARVAELKKQLAADDADKKELEGRIKEAESGRRPQPMIRALWARGEPSPTYVLRRGNYLTPGALIGPGVPDVLDDGSYEVVRPPQPGATGRRLALAKWLTRPNHPLTARVIVNRIWQAHFGIGLVSTPGNFGVAGARPSHPRLLDWLAVELVESSWSIKHIQRLIVTSHAYRQRSRGDKVSEQKDPRAIWLSRRRLRRMDAETIRDSLIQTADLLRETPFGKPDAVVARGDGLVIVQPQDGSYRRSVYVQHRRTQMPTLLENFDSPQMSPNCLERDSSIVAPQALHLLNNKTIFALAESFAGRVRDEVGEQPGRQVQRAFLIALSRPPSPREKPVCVKAVTDLREQWRKQLTADSKQLPDAEISQRALANFCHAIVNSAAFLYID